MAVQLPETVTADDRRQCDFCGGHVTDDFRRTYGVDGRAKRCPGCDSWARLERGSAAGKDVDHPDPQENPGRSGGRQLRNETEIVADGGEGR